MVELNIYDCVHQPNQIWTLPVVTDTPVYLQGQGSGRCITEESVENNGLVDLWDCVGEQHQSWVLGPQNSGGYSQLRNRKNTSKCLTMNEGQVDLRAEINVYDCLDGAVNQLWLFRLHELCRSWGFLIDQNRGRCATVNSLGTAKGATLVLWDCVLQSAGQTQMWRILSSA